MSRSGLYDQRERVAEQIRALETKRLRIDLAITKRELADLRSSVAKFARSYGVGSRKSKRKRNP